MSQEQVNHNAECGTPAHNEHLCFLMYEGFHLSNSQDYKQLVRNAEYRCQGCGRTAARQENLCDPVEI